MLARLQSRNLNGRSPRSDPNEPFEFMNCQFDLKNSFFSSTEILITGKNLLCGTFWIVPPPGGDDFCHVGAATKPKSKRSKSQE